MPEDIWYVVITAIASPILLKALEFFFNKITWREQETARKFAVLDARITDLQNINTKQLIQIGVQQQEIQALQVQVKERDERIAELQNTVNVLTKRSRTK